MWMREPVEPASIMSAYCTSGRCDAYGVVQWTVLSGSGSVSGEVGVREGVETVGEGGEVGAASVCASMGILPCGG